MNRRLHAALASGLALLGLISTAGCSSGGAAGPAPCSPRWPTTSDYVARASQEVTVSATATTCAVRFSRDRRLTLTAVDQTSRRFALGTVRAYPSGAFEKQVRIPVAAAAGPIDIYIDGVELYCPENASCAAYAAAVLKVDSSPDFRTDPKANSVAASIAADMDSRLSKRPSLVQLAIVSDGIQATLHTDAYDREVAAFKRTFAAAQAAVPPRDRRTADAAQLHIKTSWRSKAELDRLNTRIGDDRAWQNRHHLSLSGWGPDPATGTVRITLARYSDAAAIALTKRYGEAVSISTRGVVAIAN